LFLPPSLSAWSESASVFLILTTCFSGGMMTNFDINVFITSSEKLFQLCKIGRAPNGYKLISYNADRELYNVARCLAGHRQMLLYTDAGWHTHARYVTTQEKIIKNRPVPGRLSKSPIIFKSLKSYGVCFIRNHSIILTF